MAFGPDERAQSTLVGFILLFGILVVAFASYQAVVVPNQNAEVEFNHFQDVENDFVEFRSALINSVGATNDRSVTFRLGTQYPSRLIALNPPPVSGQLETTQEGDVTIEGNILDDNIDNVCGIETPTTRSLAYTPNYNEFRNAQSVTYENTFVAREFSDGTVYGEQQLFEEESGNDRINLLLLNEAVSLSGQGTRSFEISPSNQRTVEVSNPTITIPSEFDESEWRNEILADVPDGKLDSDDGNAITGTGDGPFEITIRFDGDYDVSCQGTEVEQQESDESDSADINPQEDIIFERVERRDGTEVELVFRNIGGRDINTTAARINFYRAQSNPPETADISDPDVDDTPTELTVGGGFQNLTDNITIDENGESNILLNFNRNTNPNDWFILTLQFENGGTGQYFVSLRDEANEDGTTGGGENNGAGGELSGSLTAEVTQEGASGQGGDLDWLVTMTYGGSDEITVTAEAGTDTSDTGNIGSGSDSETLNLGRGNSNTIYPITVTGEDSSGQSCSATLEEGDGQINVCG